MKRIGEVFGTVMTDNRDLSRRRGSAQPSGATHSR